MWLIWSLFWTLAVVCRVASQDSGPTANLLLFALGCAAAAGVGWTTAACAPAKNRWKESIALMTAWALAYAAGAPAVDAVGVLSRAAFGWSGELFNLWLALALGGAFLGALSAVVLINNRLPAAQRFKKGLRVTAGWMIAFPVAIHLSLIAAYISGAFLEVGERFLLILGAVISGLLTGYLCSSLLASALRPEVRSACICRHLESGLDLVGCQGRDAQKPEARKMWALPGAAAVYERGARSFGSASDALHASGPRRQRFPDPPS